MARIKNWETEPVAVPEMDGNHPEHGRYRMARAAYFASIALRHRDVMQVHYDDNEAENNPKFQALARRRVVSQPEDALPGPRRFEARPDGAPQHCLVEAARVRVMGGMLGLAEAEIAKLEQAAMLNDSFKARETKIMKENGPTWDSYEQAQAAARKAWEDSGLFEADVMDIAGSVAHESIGDMHAILGKPDTDLTPMDKMQLVMHYADDYTFNSRWAEPAGKGRGEIDRRCLKNEQNTRYASLNQTGLDHFGYVDKGVFIPETTYQAQRRSGHMVEGRLASLICAANGLPDGAINPLDLPVIVDNQIKYELAGNM
ncbi:MAG TPA: hypothetical protein VMR45_01935 [Patescibacteria group bacterium]|nr:hypothetical protein [Patescibacteria group bacterium]